MMIEDGRQTFSARDCLKRSQLAAADARRRYYAA
jgi:hypothetical protein